MTDTLVIGSGFAGCTAVRTLRKLGYRDRITLVSPKPELFYYPSLIWVPAGRRTEAELRIDLAGFFRKHDVEYKQGSVTGLDPQARIARTDTAEVGYDYLIIAGGGRYLRKLPGIEHAHIACAGWEPTKAFSDALAQMDGGTVAFGFGGNPKEPAAMRGGPVFEFLLGTDTLLRQQGRRDRFELLFVSPAERPGQRMGPKAVDRMLGEMARRDIRTHLGHKLQRFEAGKIVTEGGEIRADLTLFIPGMTGPGWAADSALPLSEGGFIQSDPQCRVPGHEGIYVAGDAGSFPGPEWKPKQAHMADLQAEAAAKNLLARMAGQPETHAFKTELICIVDTLNNGSLVFRNAKRSFMLGAAPPIHWMKLAFEWHYLREYRSAA
jgi:sulfide:quinone oxidoreductase